MRDMIIANEVDTKRYIECGWMKVSKKIYQSTKDIHIEVTLKWDYTKGQEPIYPDKKDFGIKFMHL